MSPESATPVMVGRPSEVVGPKPQGDEAKPKRTGSSVVHHVIRTISKDGSAQGGSQTTEQIEEYLLSYLRGGWKLMDAIYLEKAPEGYTFCWVLYRE